MGHGPGDHDAEYYKPMNGLLNGVVVRLGRRYVPVEFASDLTKPS